MQDAQKIERIKTLMQEWIDKQGHERCWYYPDIFNKLVEILEITPSKSPQLPPLNEFKKGCKKYQREEFKFIS